jgi:hydroxymethylglutaryl-CoA reductase
VGGVVSEEPPSGRSSRIAGFYRRTPGERLRHLVGLLSPASRDWLERGGGLAVAEADRMSENVVATAGLPLSVGLNLRVGARDYLVPMAVEEPSVVAAVSNAARLVRLSGGFRAEADEPIATAQIQLDGVPDAREARHRVFAARARILAAGDAAIPRMVARGGGCVDADARVLDVAEGLVVVEVHVHVGDAMGANLADTVAEACAPVVQDVLGGRVGLRILTNLCLRRRARAWCRISDGVLGDPALADGIARASRFAERDPARAATHNKGVMNGIDAAALALGQDWRALEAGAHAFAARSGRYRPLSTWSHADGVLTGQIELPLAVGTVGGATHTPGARAALELVAVTSARELAGVLAAVGLAANLAALRALAGEGIQRGHMELHHRRTEGGDAAEAASRR